MKIIQKKFSEKFFGQKDSSGEPLYSYESCEVWIVSRGSDFVYSSASNFVRNEGVIEVCISSVPIIDPMKQKSIIEINGNKI